MELTRPHAKRNSEFGEPNQTLENSHQLSEYARADFLNRRSQVRVLSGAPGGCAQGGVWACARIASGHSFGSRAAPSAPMYASLLVSRYRVWCLEELRRHWQEGRHGFSMNIRSAFNGYEATDWVNAVAQSSRVPSTPRRASVAPDRAPGAACAR